MQETSTTQEEQLSLKEIGLLIEEMPLDDEELEELHTLVTKEVHDNSKLVRNSVRSNITGTSGCALGLSCIARGVEDSDAVSYIVGGVILAMSAMILKWNMQKQYSNSSQNEATQIAKEILDQHASTVTAHNV